MVQAWPAGRRLPTLRHRGGRESKVWSARHKTTCLLAPDR